MVEWSMERPQGIEGQAWKAFGFTDKTNMDATSLARPLGPQGCICSLSCKGFVTRITRAAPDGAAFCIYTYRLTVALALVCFLAPRPSRTKSL